MRIMGLDASTTTIGLAIIDYENNKCNLIHTEYFKPPKEGELFSRLNAVREYISLKINEFKPDHVALEDIILFMRGASSATTITSLTALNRTVGLAVLNALNEAPCLIGVVKVRNTIKQTPESPDKSQIPDTVSKILGIEFPWIRNKKGKVIEENFDISDSIGVALAFIMMPVEQRWKANLPKPKKTRKSSKKTKAKK